jgi:hypothetical protein
MALIRSLTLDEHEAKPPRTEVDCLFRIVLSPRDGRLLRLATLGSDDRKLQPKPSQIIELNEATARELVGIIDSVFPPQKSADLQIANPAE